MTMEKRVKLLMRIDAGDIVHLKLRLKAPTLKSKLPFNLGYNKFCGQKAIITSVSITYGEKKHIGYSFICKLANVNNDKSIAQFPLDAIDRSYPLIRNGKKFSLLHKKLYLHLP